MHYPGGKVLNPFIEEVRRRPRAFWRLVLQFVVSTVLTIVVISVFRGTLVAGGLADGSSQGFVVSSVASLVATLASLFLAARFIDRRRFRDYGFRLGGGWFLDLGFGMLLGAFLMGGIFLTQLALGWVTVSDTFYSGAAGVPFVVGIILPAITFLCVGIYEEAVSRGYQIKNLAEGLSYPALGTKIPVLLAWVSTSAVFGFLHLGNPNSTLLSTVNIALAGILLGVGYVLSGELALPIGLHITWNFFQGSVFGFPVSGLTGLGGSFISIEQSGPELWTGGEFGPEAGLIAPVAIFTGTVAIALWMKFRRGRLRIDGSIATPPEPPETRTVS